MAAVYPGAVRIYSSKTDLVDLVLADHVNLLQDEVTAVETTLGTGVLVSSWSGSFATPSSHATLTARLVNIEAGIVSKQDAATAVTLTGVQTLTNKTLASPNLTGAPVATTPTAGDSSTRIATTAFVTTATSGSIAAHTSASSGVHGISGSVVGTTDTQILSGKTLSAPVISGAASLTGTISTSGSGKFVGLGAISIVTSTTRPASPTDGQAVYETDTDKLVAWNGSEWKTVSGAVGYYQTTAPTAVDIGAIWVDSDASTSGLNQNDFLTKNDATSTYATITDLSNAGYSPFLLMGA